MPFASWDIFVFSHLLLAVAVIAHVLIVHLAVGGSCYFVVTEHLAHRRGNLQLLAYLKTYSPVFVLGTLVLGVLSRVVLWMLLAFTNPDASMAMLRIFAWGWASEGVVMAVAISAALIYIHTWERLDHRSHLTIGWIYSASAWIGLAFLNGTLAFLLTPGQWLETHNFWHAFFNPSALPALVLRTLVAFALIGLVALLTATWLSPEARRSTMVRYSSCWLAPPFILMPMVVLFSVATLPAEIRDNVLHGAVPPLLFVVMSIGLSVTIFLLSLYSFSQPALVTSRQAVLIMGLGLLAIAGTECQREVLRRPFPVGGNVMVTVPPETPRPRATTLPHVTQAVAANQAVIPYLLPYPLGNPLLQDAVYRPQPGRIHVPPHPKPHRGGSRREPPLSRGGDPVAARVKGGDSRE